MINLVAVVLTYNRPELLEENINAVLNQELLPSELIIVDNHSSDDTEKRVTKYLDNGKLPIRYEKLDRNYGSAGGFYYAIKIAYDLGYDYILTMDDDGKPFKSNTFSLLVKAVENAKKINEKLIIGPLVTYDGLHVTFGPDYSEEYVNEAQMIEEPVTKDYISPYNGTIISRKCIDAIGFPDKEFYLYGDEIEYMMRAKENGVILQTVVNAIYQHPKANERINRFFGKNLVSYEGVSRRKQYYYIRNHYYAFKIHGENMLAFRLFINRLLSIIFFEKSKMSQLKLLNMSIKDAKNKNIHEKMDEI